MQHITLVTGNPNKAREVAAILGFEIGTQALDLPEIQSFSLEEIVREKVATAFARVGSPVLVEDVSFEIAALNGFPGPFIKFWEKQRGHDLYPKLNQAFGTDRAAACAGVGYADKNGVIFVESRIEGRVTSRRGEEGSGWGFDYYFQPDGYDGTFAKLGADVKNNISHRARAWAAMRDELRSRNLA